jgi:hypothetical protein
MPTQPFTVGVTVIVPVSIEAELFVAVKEGTGPDPAADKPMAVLLLVHVKVPPAGALIKLVKGIMAPLHTATLEGATTIGVGFTLIT